MVVGCLVWLVVAAVASVWELGQRWITPGRAGLAFVQIFMWWGRWALLPALVALGISLATTKRRRWWRVLLAAVLVLGAWGSLIEPAVIVQRDERAVVADAPRLRVAIVSDLHIGLHGRDLPGLVARINALDVDAVLVAGDWTYEPWLDLDAVFAPLSDLNHPAYGVLGNHDLRRPGPDFAVPLQDALTTHGVTLIDGRSVMVNGWELVGLDDLWGGDPGSQVPTLLGPRHAPRLVLMHQPDTVSLLPDASADVIVAGHTHGGQIRIPFVTDWLVRTVISPGGYGGGRYETPAGTMLVSSGVGMVGPPVRIGVPPEIIVAELGRL